MKHTEEPWIVLRNNAPSMLGRPDSLGIRSHSAENLICNVYNQKVKNFNKRINEPVEWDVETTEANAKLIAASPDMLRELIEAWGLVTELIKEGCVPWESTRVQEFLESSEQAIKKATT